MDEIKRLMPAQRARCNRLIRRLCANYDGGNCLPLDDGEGCVCVHGPANGAESPLHPAATGRNTARNAGAPSGASRRRTLPDGGAASNIKRRKSLDFRGFFEGKAGAGGRFHLHLSKSISNILQRRNFYG